MNADEVVTLLIPLHFIIGVFSGLAWAKFDPVIAEYLKPPVCFRMRVRLAMIAWIALWPVAFIFAWVLRDEIRSHGSNADHAGVDTKKLPETKRSDPNEPASSGRGDIGP